MLFLLELAGIFCGILYISGYAAQTPRPVRSLTSAAIVSASAWTAEESCILMYRFYDYHPGWSLFLDQVPLLIVVIWPVIIFSAMELTSHLRAAHPGLGLLAGAAVVATDASFIEPLCVNAGLWRWKLPGFFDVPPIGILGWFFFALLCMALLADNRVKASPAGNNLMLLVIPVVATHVLLVLAWWGALRWIQVSFAALPSVVFIWCLSFTMVFIFHKRRTGASINKRTLLLRIPAALFFFSLLLLSPNTSTPLTVFAVAFIPPYVTLMLQQYQRRRS